MIKRWVKWRMDRGHTFSNRPERFIANLLYKLGRKELVVSKAQFKYGVDAIPYVNEKRKKPDYAIRPAVYRSLHGTSEWGQGITNVMSGEVNQQANQAKPTSK